MSAMSCMGITLTGADERTDLDALVELSGRNPRLEIGLLYTATPEGRNRYPGMAWLTAAAERLSGRVAIHVCGRTARQQLLSHQLGHLTRHAPRVQVNGVVTTQELIGLANAAAFIITQHTEANASLVDAELPNHGLLIDNSGGRGVSPERWERVQTDKPVGFAGGLGPDNLVQELPRIGVVARPGAWVDMEGKLRVEDWFDQAVAERCLRAFDTFSVAGMGESEVTIHA